MVYKGIIMEIDESTIIVMNQEGGFDRLKRLNKPKIGDAIYYTEDDVAPVKASHTTILKAHQKVPAKIIGTMAAAILILFMIVPMIQQSFNTQEPSNDGYPSFTTIIALDINPSFRLMIDKQNKVVSIEAANSDAQSIARLDDMIGLYAEEAIEGLVTEAEAYGFIDTKDYDEDYILLTLEEQNGQDDSGLRQRIREKAVTSQLLRKVSIAIVTGNRAQFEKAAKSPLPTGLYVLGVEDTTTVKEYMADRAHLIAVEEKGEVIYSSPEYQVKRLEEEIDALSLEQADNRKLKEALNQLEKDYKEIRAQYEGAIQQFDEALTSGEEEAIKLAQKALRQSVKDQRDIHMDLRQVGKAIQTYLKDNEKDTLSEEEAEERVNRLLDNMEQKLPSRQNDQPNPSIPNKSGNPNKSENSDREDNTVNKGNDDSTGNSGNGGKPSNSNNSSNSGRPGNLSNPGNSSRPGNSGNAINPDDSNNGRDDGKGGNSGNKDLDKQNRNNPPDVSNTPKEPNKGNRP